MAIQIGPVIILHERRIRVTFTAALAIGAFTSIAYYSVTSLSGQAVSPSVVAAYVVANSSHVVELVLGADLVQGQAYRISAVGVPAQDATTTLDPSTQDATYGTAPRTVGRVKAGVSELDEVLYSRDLVFTEGDFIETVDGDLATIAGEPNLFQALERRLESNGLPWDPTYGLRAYDHVDGTGTGLLPLRGRAEAQMKADDRVSSAVARVTADQDTSSGYVEVDVKPIGAGDLAQLKIPVGL